MGGAVAYGGSIGSAFPVIFTDIADLTNRCLRFW
jgi:hypothetical protein